MDSIIAGFERVFPELGINTYADMPSMDILISISTKIAPFINAMLDSGEHEEYSLGAVIDVYQLLPCDYVKHIDSKICGIVYLGSSDVTPDERFAIQKRYDTKRDYTFYKTDEELREGADYIVEQSKLIKSQCEQFKLLYYDTSYNRFETFDKIIGDVTRKNHE
jgi:hypothetical protein